MYSRTLANGTAAKLLTRRSGAGVGEELPARNVAYRRVLDIESLSYVATSLPCVYVCVHEPRARTRVMNASARDNNATRARSAVTLASTKRRISRSGTSPDCFMHKCVDAVGPPSRLNLIRRLEELVCHVVRTKMREIYLTGQVEARSSPHHH